MGHASDIHKSARRKGSVKPIASTADDAAPAQPLRPLPEIDASGRLVGFAAEPEGGGEILLMRHGGIDVLGRFSEAEILAASRSRPARILLSYGTQTKADRRKSAIANAMAYVFLALLPGLLLGALFKGIAGAWVMVAVLLGAASWGFAREMFEPGKVWERSAWMDFETRTWRARRDFPDHSLPDHSASIPLAELTQVCFTHQWEQGVSYDIGFARLADVTALRRYYNPAILNVIQSSSDQQRSAEFAAELAGLWGMPCWQIDWGSSAGKRTLA
jgi:hypothetical protein